MVFHHLWPNIQTALGPTTSGGFIEVNNCPIWCSTAHKPFLKYFCPPLFTKLENCAVQALTIRIFPNCLLHNLEKKDHNKKPFFVNSWVHETKAKTTYILKEKMNTMYNKKNPLFKIQRFVKLWREPRTTDTQWRHK